MNKVLESVFNSRSFVNNRGETIEIHSETSKEQCAFLQKTIEEKGLKNSIEIGCAFGISSVAILEAVIKNGGNHYVIDKFEYTGWKGYGLDLIQQAGFAEHLTFYEEYCYIVLPELLRQGKLFDFAYVDSTKQLDWLMVDFFYLDKLLRIGGVIVFDDVSFPSIRKLMRYISQYPHFEVYQTFPENQKPSLTRMTASFLRKFPYSTRVFKNEIIKSDFELGINTNCVILVKKGEDTRNWDWHIEF